MAPERSQSTKLQSLLRQGFEALSRGQLRAANDCCRRVLALQGDLVQGHFLTGLVALEAGDRKTAFSAFASVTRLQPDHAAAWAQLARLFMSDGQVGRADAALAEAVKTPPADPLVQDLLGSVYSMMGEHGLAETWYTKATDAQPEHPPYLLNLANNRVYHGRTREAETLLNTIIRIQPDSPQAHWSLAGVRKAQDHSHIDELRDLVSKARNPRVQAFYYYALGKEFEDLEEWDAAFAAFSAGARARRETVEYDESAEIEMFAFLEENFTAKWLGDSATTGNPSTAPIFVLGQPRTGTTLIERIISSHSQVHSAGELQQLGLAVRRLSKHQDPRRFSAEFFAAVRDVDPGKTGALYLESTKRMGGTAPHFVDKLPQNYLMIPLILKALPNAKIVHLTRDPMDACFASYKQLFADAYLHSYDLREMARHHCRYLRLMQCWRERFGDRFLDVSYEDTVNEFEGNARRLVNFLNLPWEDACLEFHKQSAAVSTASAVQVRQPVHTRSIGRWRRYESQLSPMLAELERCRARNS